MATPVKDETFPAAATDDVKHEALASPSHYLQPPMMMSPGNGGGWPPMPPMGMPPPYPPSYQHYPPGYGAPPARVLQDDQETQVCLVAPAHGLPYSFDVPFPPRKLPVCCRCKKNFKSRDICRARDGHRALPWTATNVVVTITDEVLSRAEDGTLSYLDIPVTAELKNIPDLCKGPAGTFMTSQSICRVCKDKNYTRDYCRNTCKHTTPPSSTIYVKLVPKTNDNVLPRKKKRKMEEEALDNAKGEEGEDEDTEHKSDDLSIIHESKTFFMIMSAEKITVKWCEQILYPDVAESLSHPPAAATESMQMQMPPYMNAENGMQGTSMQHQMWEAFRAGAMWAQSQAAQMPPEGYGMPQDGAYAPDPANMNSPSV